MNKTIRLALIGASILALTSPVLARTAAKGDRMTSHLATGVGEPTAPASLRERAPEPLPVYGWMTNAGFDLRLPLGPHGAVRGGECVGTRRR